MDEKKVTVLKRTEDGKVKSLLIFNEANEQARLYFSDDEKLTRMVVGNGSQNLVAFDRVGDLYVSDPLTPGGEEKGARWHIEAGVDNDSKKSFHLCLSDSSGQYPRCIDPETHKPSDYYTRYFLHAERLGMMFAGIDGITSLYLDLEKDGHFEGMHPNRDSGTSRPCEIIEQNVTKNVPEKQQTESLVQKAMKDHLTR